MELQFGKREISCLGRVVSQVQNLEQTQELRIPQGMPGAERMLGCWGQILIRSKEWERDCVRLSGGVQTWVLYEPEEGQPPQTLETWIPFQMDWDLPENCPEGQLQVMPRLRFSDARLVSAGKILIRVGIGVCAWGWTENTAVLSYPESVPEDVELLRETFPVRLPREAGEKVFELEEQLTLPGSMPRPEKLFYYRLEPEVTDQKVMANKVVFRGSGNLHLLFQGEDGDLHSWQAELPFSQYAQLETGYSPDAQGMVTMMVTALELEGDPEGTLHLKAAMTGQYLVEDREVIQTVSDAWSPVRQVEPEQQALDLGTILDSRRELLRGEGQLALEADRVVDAQLLPDFPRQRSTGDGLILEQSGMVQMLVRDREGKLQPSSQRLEGQLHLPAHETALLTALPLGETLETGEAGQEIRLHWQQPLQLQTMAGQGLPMVTGLTLGDRKEPDPERPSLILRRAGRDRLWDIARQSGSTMAAIEEANDLQGQPAPEKMLLIPVI